MPTRLYLPSTGAAAVSPAYFAGWDDSSQAAARLKCVRTRISSAMATVSINDWAGIANGEFLWRQYVSDPIPAQTISGTVKGQLRVMEGDAIGNHDQILLVIRVVSNDGSTVRGTLLTLGAYAAANEYSIEPTLTNRKMADGDALSSVVAQANDRIVIEIGTRPSTAPGGTDTVISAVFGDDSGTDLPEDTTTTAANNPWIEFSQDNIFTPPSQTSTPASIEIPVAVNAGAVLAGGVTSAPAAIDVPVTVNDGAVLAGVQASQPASIEIPVAVNDPGAGSGLVPDTVDASNIVGAAEGTGLYIIRGSSTLGDQDDLTGVADATPGSWPSGTGTVLASQNVNGPTLPTDIVVEYVVFCARGVTTQDGAGTYLSNLRAEISGGSYPLAPAFPDFRPYTVGAESYADQCAEARSNPVYTKPGGGAWTWADLVAIPSVTIRMDHANITTVPHLAEMFVSEIWVEVFTPQGAAPDRIILRQNFGKIRYQQTVQTVV